MIENVGKIPSLNGIRALSVLLVIASHSGFGDVVPGGLGVTVFFFLSGFLITTLFIREESKSQRINILHFYARRGIRLYPAMLITIVAAYSLAYFGQIGGESTILGALAQIFYFANYFNIFFDGANYTPAGTGVFWSLSVEEHFYLVYPLIFSFFILNYNQRKLVVCLFVVIVTILLWRIYLFEVNSVSDSRILYASDTRIDSIAFGCLLAILKNPVGRIFRDKLSVKDYCVLFLSILLLVFTLIYRDEMFRLTFRFTLQGAALCVVFYYAIACYRHPVFRILETNVMDKVGTYSYTMYLVHFILIAYVDQNIALISNKYALFSFVVLCSAFIGWGVFKYVEKPLSGYKHRYS